MKLYRNLASGHLFIGINDDVEEIEEDKGLLLITPQGKIKRLEEHLFEPVDSGDATGGDRLVKMLTKEQREKHRQVLGSINVG